MRKNSIKISIVTAGLFYAIFHVLYYIKLNEHWWKDGNLIVFMPIWTLGIFISSFLLSRKYYRRKDYFIKNRTFTEWKQEKKIIKLKILSTVKLLFAAAVPFLLFECIYKEEQCGTYSILVICLFIFLAIFLSYIEYKLKKKMK